MTPNQPPDAEVLVIDPTTDSGPPHSAARDALITYARELLVTALGTDLADDRLDPPWPPAGLAMVIETSIGGYLGGLLPQDTDQTWTIDGVLVDPNTKTTQRADRLWNKLKGAATPAGRKPPTQIELWGKPGLEWHAELAIRLGLKSNRKLLQLRCPLPIDDDAASSQNPLPTRAFDIERDVESLLEVNNRAFAWHPEQSNMSESDLLSLTEQPWFQAQGLRVADDPDDPTHLLGFCWTKIHEPSDGPAGGLGEIYVIGVDPKHHGKGYGAPMTASGLDWLTAQGLKTAMLYVEADNDAALAVYRRLGFTTHRTDRSWLGPWPEHDLFTR